MAEPKPFFYKFIPSKAEEEACQANNTPWVTTLEPIEINDMYTPPEFDLNNPWKIKKRITHEEIVQGRLVIPFSETFKYILCYWTSDETKKLEDGFKILVQLWDVTETIKPKKYQNGSVYFEMLPNDDFSLSCSDLFKNRKLAVGFEIGLFWEHVEVNAIPSCFHFKLLSECIEID